MRTLCLHFLIAVSAAVAVCSFAAVAIAQPANIEVRLRPETSRAVIEVKDAPASSWSFLDSYAGIVGLGRRIEHFAAFDEKGTELLVTEAAPGQFKSTSPAGRIRYEVSLHPVSRAAEFSHLSWLDKERGVLMALDLLPLKDGVSGAGANRRIHFQLTAPWAVHSNELKVAQDEFSIADVERAVFVVGTNLRISQANAAGVTLNFVTNSEWSFSDAEALQLGQQVLSAHRETFGSVSVKTATLVLFPFPLAVGASRWSAETRGATVTLIMGKLPSKVAALAQLSTPVAHEFFHLWIPNAINLTGNYDWFYEGFTIYQSSQTAVKLGLLTFPEFLNAIARAYDSSKGEPSLSLVEASNRRFTGGLNFVYDKSQVIAFLYDLRLRSMTRNKRSLADVYRRLIRLRDAAPADGNDAVTKVLTEVNGSGDFVQSFIQNAVSLNLTNELAPFGLNVETGGFRTRISVNEKLSQQQRDLLRELGYNAATHATR
jgi:predicted metalloprotease with PDZ domain